MWHLIRALLLLIPRLIYSLFAWVFSYSNHPEKTPLEKRYRVTRKLIRKVNKALKLDIQVIGKENLPKEVSCYFCNHLAAIDPLLFIDTFEKPITFVAKDEIKKMVHTRRLN